MIESIHTKEDLAERKTPPTIIVIFGASGDLTARKLVPAIFNLSKDNLLPNKCFLIGYGRSSMSDEVVAYTANIFSTPGGRKGDGRP